MVIEFSGPGSQFSEKAFNAEDAEFAGDKENGQNWPHRVTSAI
jgi:hypothetical protein